MSKHPHLQLVVDNTDPNFRPVPVAPEQAALGTPEHEPQQDADQAPAIGSISGVVEVNEGPDAAEEQLPQKADDLSEASAVTPTHEPEDEQVAPAHEIDDDIEQAEPMNAHDREVLQHVNSLIERGDLLSADSLIATFETASGRAEAMQAYDNHVVSLVKQLAAESRILDAESIMTLVKTESGKNEAQSAFDNILLELMKGSVADNNVGLARVYQGYLRTEHAQADARTILG